MSAPGVVPVEHPLLGPSPCDQCPTAARCSELRMCCRVFVQFVEGPGRLVSTALSRLPSRRRYVSIYGDAPVDDSLDDERAHVAATVAAAGSVPEAAALLGMQCNALYRRLYRWGLR